MFDKTIMLYVTFIVGIIFGGGSIIRLYGNTCGLSILDPGSWFRSTILMASPWCRGLNWMSYIVSSVIENIWYHGIASIVGLVYNYSGLKDNTSRLVPSINTRSKVA